MIRIRPRKPMPNMGLHSPSSTVYCSWSLLSRAFAAHTTQAGRRTGSPSPPSMITVKCPFAGRWLQKLHHVTLRMDTELLPITTANLYLTRCNHDALLVSNSEGVLNCVECVVVVKRFDFYVKSDAVRVCVHTASLPQSTATREQTRRSTCRCQPHHDGSQESRSPW